MKILLPQLLIASLSGVAAAAAAGPGPDAFGNEIPDFSMAGYRHGGVALPVSPVVERLRPAAGGADDANRITPISPPSSLRRLLR
jgi:hypothetical protein